MRIALLGLILLSSGCAATTESTATMAQVRTVSAEVESPFPVADHHLHLLSLASIALFTPPFLGAIAIPEDLNAIVRQRWHSWNDQPALEQLYAPDAIYYAGTRSGWTRGNDAAAGYVRWTISDTPYRFVSVSYSRQDGSAQVAGYAVEDDGSERIFGTILFSLVQDPNRHWRIAAENYLNWGVSEFEPPQTAADAVAEMGAAGIERAAVLSGVYFFDLVRPEPTLDALTNVRADNDWTAEQVSQSPQRLVVREEPAVQVAAVPERVCLPERNPAYVNFDFAVDNATDREVAVSEVRVTVRDASGSVVERRVVWQGALNLLGLGAEAKIAPRSRALMFNPLHFSASVSKTAITYEFHFAEQAAPVAVTVMPQLCRTKASLRLPLSGRVLVLDGHDVLSHHRRFDFLAPWAQREGLTDNAQRFALDLVVVDEAGAAFAGAGVRNEDFYGWGKPVRAPAEGVVVAAHSTQPDNDEVGAENKWTGDTWESAGGNYVIIRHNANEFSTISHLRQSSVTVRVGDSVRAGQIVGQVGNSGSSLMPHVHYQLHSAAGRKGVSGLPAYFRAVRLASGESAPSHGLVIDTGDIVLNE